MGKISVIDTETFILAALEIYGTELFDFKFVNYINYNSSVKILCKKCNYILSPSPGNFLYQINKCPQCEAQKHWVNFRKKLEKKFTTPEGNLLYDYSETKYINSRIPLNIKCNTCGHVFFQRIFDHAKGKYGCNFCFQKQGETDFIEKSKKIHQDIFGNPLYDYTQVKYIKNSEKVKIFCIKCSKYFNQTPQGHLSGNGCSYCFGDKISKKKLGSTKQFIEKAQKKHGNKYDYSKVNYINSNIKVEIICKKHGSFFIRPTDHTAGKSGCLKCQIISEEELIKILDLFPVKCSIKKFNYKSSIIFFNCINCNAPVERTFSNIRNDQFLCLSCSMKGNSQGETLIRSFLETQKINFFNEYTFSDLVNPKTKCSLYFDFYLPDYNLCIEFDGIQHYKEHLGFNIKEKKASFKELKYRDYLKDLFCINKQIKLIRIPYFKMGSIKDILTKELMVYCKKDVENLN